MGVWNRRPSYSLCHFNCSKIRMVSACMHTYDAPLLANFIFYRVLPIVLILLANGSSDDILLKIYLFLLAVLQTSLCIGELVAAIISSRGTMNDSAPRRGLPAALYVQTCLLALVLAWSIVGVVLAHGPCTKCDLAQAASVLSYLTIVWSVLVTLGVALYMRIIKADTCGLLLRLGKVRKYDRLIASETVQAQGKRLSRVSKGSLAQHLRQKTWQWKLEFLLCCLCWKEEDRQAVYSEVSEALAESFFRSPDYDYVSSDIVAGLELIAMAEEVCSEVFCSTVSHNAFCTVSGGIAENSCRFQKRSKSIMRRALWF